jgi:hypothetical protein
MGGDLPGVYTVRGIADIDAMQARILRRAAAGGDRRRLYRAGGRRRRPQAGPEVTVVEAAPRILAASPRPKPPT